jgi:hypothetical protein
MNDLTGKDFDDIDDVSDFIKNKYGKEFDSNKDLLKYLNSSPNFSPGSPLKSQYLNTDKDIISYPLNRDLRKMHTDFVENPTLQNAHELQSQLGYEIRDLERVYNAKNLDPAGKELLGGYKKARTNLLTDINNFLSTKSESLSNQYKNATSNWAANVTPYLSNSKIAPIAKGDITNPDNITSIFGSPEKDTQKIADDIGQAGKNKILYNELGKPNVNGSPEKQVAAFKNLDTPAKGLGDYVNDELANKFKGLESRISARNWASLGTAPFLNRALLQTVKSVKPSDVPRGTSSSPLVDAITQFLNMGYKPVAGSAVANTVGGTNGS